jgi:hypothetical protein
MKKFTVKAIDLDAELELLDGSTVLLTSPIKLTKDAIQASKELQDMTEKFTSKGEKTTLEDAVNYTAGFLGRVYDKDPAWFVDNVNQSTMSELVVYIQGEFMGSVKKQGE